MNKKIKLLISSISMLALCNVTEVMNMPIREAMSGIAYNSNTSPTTRSISKKTLQKKLDKFEESLEKRKEKVSLLCHRIYGLCETLYKTRYSNGDRCYVVKKVSKSCRELLGGYSIYQLLSENHKSYYRFNCKSDDGKSLRKQVMTERNKLQRMFRQVQLLCQKAEYIMKYDPSMHTERGQLLCQKAEYIMVYRKYESAITDLKNLAVRLISACECIASLPQG